MFEIAAMSVNNSQLACVMLGALLNLLLNGIVVVVQGVALVSCLTSSAPSAQLVAG